MGEVTIDGLDLVDVLNFIDKKKGKFISESLSSIEQIIDDPEQYKAVRKIVLDGYNDYTDLFYELSSETLRVW